MSDLRERIKKAVFSGPLDADEWTDGIIAAIAPDCEATEGLSVKERHLWLAIHGDKELEQLQDGEWCDASQEVVNLWAPLRIKTQPVKPRVARFQDTGDLRWIQITPEVRACLIEKGLLDE